MNILIYRWRAYNDTDIIGSFRLMGHTVSEFGRKLVSYDEDPEFEAALSAELKHTHYDFVFTVNYFAAISEVCFSCGTPYVVWTCDNPLISMFHKSLFYPTNYIFTFDKTNELELKGMGVTQVWHLPLAVDTNRLDEVIALDGKTYEHEVCFIGSLYERNTYDKLEASLPPYLRGYFDAAIEAQLQISTGNLLERLLTPEIMAEVQEYVELEKSEDSFSDLSLIFATTVLGFKVAAEQRSRALRQLFRSGGIGLRRGQHRHGKRCGQSVQGHAQKAGRQKLCPRDRAAVRHHIRAAQCTSFIRSQKQTVRKARDGLLFSLF